MTCKISRPLLAIALAAGMLAAVSSPSFAALSTADRTNAIAVPATETAVSTESLAPQKLAAVTPIDPAPVAKVAPLVRAEAPVAARPRKAIAQVAAPRRFAAVSRIGYRDRCR